MSRRLRIAIALLAPCLAAATPFGDRPTAALVALCLALWLTELVPPFVPTLLLLAGAPWVIRGETPAAALGLAIDWAADPVLVLFLGGLVLAAAARRHGLDVALAERVVAWSGGSVRRLAALALVGTAFLSMWMSNVASCALVMGALAPLLERLEKTPLERRALLVAIAMGANVGGIVTPIGSGPNGIAIAAVAPRLVVSFASWMAFAAPLAALLLAAAYLLVRPRIARTSTVAAGGEVARLESGARRVLAVAAAAVLLWLTEPLHGMPSAAVAIALAAALFVSGLLRAEDLSRVDGSTLLLVAGGVLVGKLVEEGGLVGPLVTWLASEPSSSFAVRLGLCALAAVLSALMSNTATAALLIPVALRIDPTPVSVLLVALATSLGCPFVVSTPPNALAGRLGATAGDLARPGLLLLVGGVILLAVTGPTMLGLFGVR